MIVWNVTLEMHETLSTASWRSPYPASGVGWIGLIVIRQMCNHTCSGGWGRGVYAHTNTRESDRACFCYWARTDAEFKAKNSFPLDISVPWRFFSSQTCFLRFLLVIILVIFFLLCTAFSQQLATSFVLVQGANSYLHSQTQALALVTVFDLFNESGCTRLFIF